MGILIFLNLALEILNLVTPLADFTISLRIESVLNRNLENSGNNSTSSLNLNPNEKLFK